MPALTEQDIAKLQVGQTYRMTFEDRRWLYRIKVTDKCHDYFIADVFFEKSPIDRLAGKTYTGNRFSVCEIVIILSDSIDNILSDIIQTGTGDIVKLKELLADDTRGIQ